MQRFSVKFDSQQAKQELVSSITNIIQGLLQELSNDLGS